MDTLKVVRLRGQGRGRGRGGIGHLISRIFNTNKNNITSNGNHQIEMIFSPQSQGKKITSYDTLRCSFIHYIRGAVEKEYNI